MNRYAVLCPGQGGQHPALFERIRNEPAAQPVLDAVRRALDRDLEELAADPSAARTNRNAQLLIVAAGVSAWRALAAGLPPPALYAGYSVGELTAYGCAQSFEVAELFAVTGQRAALMSEATTIPAGLAAVRGGNDDLMRELCSAARVHVAIINGPGRYVVGGSREALVQLARHAEAMGLAVTPLSVEVPAHTPLLRTAVNAFRGILATSTMRSPVRPVLAGIDGREISNRTDAITALAEQLAAPIQWHRCMTSLVERGCRVFLELPPGRALSQMLGEQFDDVEARAVEDFKTLDGARDWVLRQLA